MREEEFVRKHMYLVTGNEDSCRKWSNPDNAFLLPRHSRCETFGSFSAAGILVVAFFGFGRPNDRLRGYIVSLDSLSTKFAQRKKKD